MAVNIVVPEMGESIVDARVAKWLKQPGDAVSAGEALVELETDKVDVEVSAPQNGVLESIAHPAGTDVKIGEVLGTIAAGAGATAPAKADAPAATPAAKHADVPATPSARKAARELNVELTAVKADGPRVTKADVDKSTAPVPPAAAAAPVPAKPAVQAPAPVAKPAVSAPSRPAGSRQEERIRMSKRRATIAKRLVEAQQTAAMLTTFNEVDMTKVMALRERQKESFKTKYGIGLGIASFFVKASIAALREFPRLNAEIQGDEMVLKHYYDIGMAVGAPEGLVVPVLRDADAMSFAGIEGAIRAFAAKAKDGSLTLEDIKGGTFSITNGGVFGSLMSTPILNPPQVGILGLHAIKERPVGVNGQIVLRPMMYTALTYDHRIVDGSEAVRFLVRVKELIEDPGVLLIES
ncbi:MAG: 2-oxoglutarate dehydrogenase complex dihydrolipoyllysine-residue succinyltransferase [Acidobacteriota bacterium]